MDYFRATVAGMVAVFCCTTFAQTADENDDAPPSWPPRDVVNLTPGSIDLKVPVVVNESAPYADRAAITGNVVEGCPELGRQLSSETQDRARNQGFTVTPKTTPDTKADRQVLVLTIEQVTSRRRGLFHDKSIRIKADFYRDGKLIGNYSRTRYSSGGPGGPLSSACDVLSQVASVLAKDVSHWIKGASF